MADLVFNVAKGRVNSYYASVANNDPANSGIVLVLLKAAESDAVLKDYDTLGAILSASGNTEADFTNYARKVLTDSEISDPSPDDTNDNQGANIPEIVWSSAGGTTDNTLVKLVVCYDEDTTAGGDADLVPLTGHDFNVTTNGNGILTEITSDAIFTAS